MNLPSVPYRSDAQRALWVLFGVMAAIVVLVGVYAYPSKSGWAVFAGGCLAAIGAFAVGAILGLLFGVPHAGDKPVGGKTWSLVPNTSFDQISDWLTKILVGVGLTQLLGLPQKLQALANFISPLFGGADNSPSVGLGVVIASSVVGFMACFVWARLLLSPDLAEAGSKTFSEKLAQDAVGRQPNRPDTPLPPDRHRQAVTRTAHLANGILSGDSKIAKEVGIPLDRVGSFDLDTEDWDKLAKYAINAVQPKAK